MKKHRGKPIVPIFDQRIQKYAEDNSVGDSEELKELVESSDEALEYIDMVSGPLVGGLLQFLIRLSGTKRILEIGTFTGYSAVKMAEALPDDGLIYTLEMNLKYQKLAESHFQKSAQQSKIKLVKGNATETIDQIDEEFDLVFIDGDKMQYMFYIDKVLSKLKKGGLIVADNVLWDGMVLDPQDNKSQAIADFNSLVHADPRMEVVLLPVRDGVSLIRKF